MRFFQRDGRRSRRDRRRAPRVQPRLRVESLEERQLLSTVPSGPFVFGTANTPVPAGAIGVPGTVYTPDRGYGWATDAIWGFDTPTSDPMVQGLSAGYDNTFLVDLPNGTYDVTPTLGNAQGVGSESIWLQGQQVATNLQTVVGQFLHPTYRINVTNGQLALRLAQGTNWYFEIDNLTITPVNANPVPTGSTNPMESTSSTGSVPSGPFVFGTANTPVPAGAIGVPGTVYTPDRGYGWATDAIWGFDTPTSDPMVQGLSAGYDNTFLVDLPNGTYDVTPTLGNAQGVSSESIWLQGQQVATNLQTVVGQFLHPTYRINVTNGQLALRLAQGTNGCFEINNLMITPVGASSSLTVAAGPTQTANEGDAVGFVGQATGASNLTYTWDFGDGGVASGTLTPQHVYQDNGTYQVTLTATSPTTSQSASSTTQVIVRNVAPTASTGGPYAITVGQPMMFRGAATDPSPVDTAAGFTYTWDFGDGTPKVSGLGLASPQHAYAVAGTYTILVTATDKDGATSMVASSTVFASALVSAALANVQLTPGWATFGEALPQGAAKGGLQVGNLVTQTDVKTTWPDGSIRFAIVTASVPAPGTYPITAAAPTTGSLTPTNPDASVRFMIGGDVYTAALPKTISNDTWLSGPLVTERRYTVDPIDPGGTLHPFLSVIFDVRSYADGESRLDVTVEDTEDKVGATSATYSVDIVANGQVLYHHDTLTQYYLTRWRKVFDLGLTESQVTLDFTPFYQARALPQYLDSVADPTYSVNGPTFDILQRGGLSYNQMNQAGARPEIAPYPDWVAQYLIHKDPTQLAYILRTGDLSGSQPIHIRNTDGSLISIDARPQFWLDPRGADKPQGDMTATTAPLDQDPIFADLEHTPSIAYVPYLITGDRYYSDEMAFWADYALTESNPYYVRNDSQGLVGDGSVRSMAWSLRNLVDAAAYLPDADPDKAYFTAKVQNNLQWFDDYANGKMPLSRTWTKAPSNTLGTSFEMLSPNMPGYENRVLISQWQQNFLAWSLSHANDQGFVGGTALRNRIVAFQNKLFNSDPDYPRLYGAPYYPTVGTVNPDGSWTMFTTMKQMFDGTYKNPDGSFRPYPLGTNSVFAGGYGVDARVSLMKAAELGMSGAQSALDYLVPQLGDDLTTRGGWALKSSS